MKMTFTIQRADGERVMVPLEAERFDIVNTNYGPVLLVRNGSVARVWSLSSNEPPWWLKDKVQKVKDGKRRRGKFIGRFHTEGGLSHSDILERTQEPA